MTSGASEVFKHKGHQGMSEKLKAANPYLAIIVSVIAIIVQGIAIPTWKGLAEKVDKHEVALAKAESWINIGPRFTKTDADLLQAQTLEQARRVAVEMDADLRRQISALGDSQARLEADLRSFRERSFEVNAELKAAVNQVVAQLNATAATFAGLNGKVTDMLVRLDTMDERKDKP